MSCIFMSIIFSAPLVANNVSVYSRLRTNCCLIIRAIAVNLYLSQVTVLSNRLVPLYNVSGEQVCYSDFYFVYSL